MDIRVSAPIVDTSPVMTIGTPAAESPSSGETQAASKPNSVVTRLSEDVLKTIPQKDAENIAKCPHQKLKDLLIYLEKPRGQRKSLEDAVKKKEYFGKASVEERSEVATWIYDALRQKRIGEEELRKTLIRIAREIQPRMWENPSWALKHLWTVKPSADEYFEN